jgi:hypothetical protein
VTAVPCGRGPRPAHVAAVGAVGGLGLGGRVSPAFDWRLALGGEPLTGAQQHPPRGPGPHLTQPSVRTRFASLWPAVAGAVYCGGPACRRLDPPPRRLDPLSRRLAWPHGVLAGPHGEHFRASPLPGVSCGAFRRSLATSRACLGPLGVSGGFGRVRRPLYVVRVFRAAPQEKRRTGCGEAPARSVRIFSTAAGPRSLRPDPGLRDALVAAQGARMVSLSSVSAIRMPRPAWAGHPYLQRESSPVRSGRRSSSERWPLQAGDDPRGVRRTPLHDPVWERGRHNFSGKLPDRPHVAVAPPHRGQRHATDHG